MAKKTVIAKPAAAKKSPSSGIIAKMKAGRGMSHGTVPGKMKGC